MQTSWLDIHASLTHFPIALIIMALVFEVGALAFKRPDWRIVSFWMIVSAALLAIPTVIAGLIASSTVFGSHPPAILPEHRVAGLTTLGASIVAMILRIAQRKNADAPAAVTSSLIVLAIAVIAAGTAGYLGGNMVLGAAGSLPTPAASTAAPGGGAIPVEPAALIAQGQAAFAANGCQSCHSMNGVGGTWAPNLTHEARRHPDAAWQIAHLKNPPSESPGSAMPPFAGLPTKTLSALAAYLVTRK